ncbi:integrase/recombinase XerD [Pseudomonas pohangensis]|uniref:Integrase/recombinase XerD n=1 Tax=Pseudomonas pohangensis TaxID=364197 RepID=A0A1H2GQD2_9PSED|nr:site-specific integrase [Pseudomonas pohangensis]SDU21682.1 integrase/recombinase XerD [Pseudomonas pohangensis]
MAQAKTLSKTELKRVLDYNAACERHAERNRAMLLLTHWTGMRIGEVVSLRLGDVVDCNGEIRSEIQLTAEQTKGNRARVVFVPVRMRKELKRYVQSAVARHSADFLFRTQKSKQFTSNTATQLLQRIYERCGLQGATSHSGRRSFITELASKGVSVRVLAALSGHRSIATTQRYIDVNDDMLRKAVELI